MKKLIFTISFIAMLLFLTTSFVFANDNMDKKTPVVFLNRRNLFIGCNVWKVDNFFDSTVQHLTYIMDSGQIKTLIFAQLIQGTMAKIIIFNQLVLSDLLSFHCLPQRLITNGLYWYHILVSYHSHYKEKNYIAILPKTRPYYIINSTHLQGVQQQFLG